MRSVLSLLLVLSCALLVQAQKPKEAALAGERAAESATLFQDYVALGRDTVPYEKLQEAKAIVIFPGLDRVSILMSEILQGNGMATVRREDGWSVPAFVVFKGTDFNFRIAGKKTFDAVFLFMSDRSADWLKKGDVFFNRKAMKVALGPVVKGTSPDDADVLYYAFDKGQLIDADLRNNVVLGAFAIFHDNNLNKPIFGMRTTALFEANAGQVKMSKEVQSLLKLISDAVPSKPSAKRSEK